MFFQRKMLYIYDTKAIYHIAVKDMGVFEEAAWFTRCALK